MRTVPSASVRSGTSSRRSRSATGAKSPHRPQVWRRSRRRISSTSRKPARGDHAEPRALALQQRIGADGGAMHDRAHRRPRRPRLAARPGSPTASSPRFDGTFAVRSVPAASSIQEQVGEGAADIDADDAGRSCATRARIAPAIGHAIVADRAPSRADIAKRGRRARLPRPGRAQRIAPAAAARAFPAAARCALAQRDADDLARHRRRVRAVLASASGSGSAPPAAPPATPNGAKRPRSPSSDDLGRAVAPAPRSHRPRRRRRDAAPARRCPGAAPIA